MEMGDLVVKDDHVVVVARRPYEHAFLQSLFGARQHVALGSNLDAHASMLPFDRMRKGLRKIHLEDSEELLIIVLRFIETYDDITWRNCSCLTHRNKQGRGEPLGVSDESPISLEHLSTSFSHFSVFPRKLGDLCIFIVKRLDYVCREE